MTNRGLVIGIALMAICLLFVAIWSLTPGGQNVQVLIGAPVPPSVSEFLPPDDLAGESFVILSDQYVQECNDRHIELTNLVVRLRGDGTAIRMLHAGRHGFPSRSYSEAKARKGATEHLIIADSSVLYADRAIRNLSKPAVIKLMDGKIVEVHAGQEFDDWGSQD